MIILTFIGALLYLPYLITESFNHNHADSHLLNLSIFYIVACFVTPIYEFSFLTKKRSLDYYLSLPIKRDDLVLFKFTCGYLKIFLSFTLVFLLGLIVVLLKGANFNYLYYLIYFLFVNVLGICLYAYNSFVFTRGNTILDGIIFTFLYSFVFLVIYETLRISLNFDLLGDIGTMSFASIINCTEMAASMIENKTLTEVPPYLQYRILEYTITYFIWIFLGIASIFGLFYSAKTAKPENAEQISDSYFGYRVLIPLMAFSFTITIQINLFNRFFDIFLYALVLIANIIGYIIYQRTFKLKRKYWIVIFSTTIIAVIIALLLK